MPALLVVVLLMFYPVTSSIFYSFTNKNLIKPTYDFTSHQAWEFYDRDSDSARVTLIARPETPEGDLTVKLKGLNPDQIYKVTVYGTDTTVAEGTGEELMTAGISYYLTPRTAVLLAVTPQN